MIPSIVWFPIYRDQRGFTYMGHVRFASEAECADAHAHMTVGDTYVEAWAYRVAPEVMRGDS